MKPKGFDVGKLNGEQYSRLDMSNKSSSLFAATLKFTQQLNVI